MILALLSLLSGLARAQLSVTAEVNRSEVPLNDQIVLSVTVSGPDASLPDPQLPQLPNFSVYSSGRSQNISFVNGKVSSSIVHTFVLEPHFVGKAQIPPISLTYQGAKVQTQPIDIQVVRPDAGGAQAPTTRRVDRGPSAGGRGTAGQTPALFVSAETDKKKVYVNEQVTLTVRFFTAVSLLGNPQYEAPRIAGFLAEDLPPERHGTTSHLGRNYYYSEIRTALFPAQAGRLTIGPATVRAQIQQDVSIDPFAPDFFDKFFSQGLAAPQTRELRSEPVSLSVEPLPTAGKPSDFSGAVGRYRLSAALDKDRAKVGDALNLTLTIEGDGNLKSVGDPKLPAMSDFRVYDTVSSLNLDKKQDRVRGSKVFKTVLVPRVSGDLAIPAISFSYFDPERGSYAETKTASLRVKVTPGAAETSAPGPDGPGAATTPTGGLIAVSQDVRYLKTRAGRPWPDRFLEALADAGPLNAAPFCAFVFALGLSFYQERAARDPRGARRRGALKTATERIGQGRLADALAGYVADKFDQPPGGLTLRRAQELLRSRSVPEDLVEEVRALWEDIDLQRFAPGAGADGELPGKARRMLETLERTLRP